MNSFQKSTYAPLKQKPEATTKTVALSHKSASTKCVLPWQVAFNHPGRGYRRPRHAGSTWNTSISWKPWRPVYSSHIAFTDESRKHLHYVSRRYYYVLAVWLLEGDDKWIYRSELSTHGPLVDPFVIILEHPHCQRIIISATCLHNVDASGIYR
jgi:hypothetical protein